MKKGKILAVIIALALVIGFSIAGTVAYLKATTDTPVKNTFTAGKLFEETGDITVTEHLAVADANRSGVYSLNTAADEVTANTYTLVPGQSIPKDPKVNVTDLNVSSYVFIEVSENNVDGVEYSVDNENWSPLMKRTQFIYGSHGGKIYFCNNVLNPTADTNDWTIYILKGTDDYENGAVTVSSSYDAAGSSFNIDIYAYICQSTGFSEAINAWTSVFAKK